MFRSLSLSDNVASKVFHIQWHSVAFHMSPFKMILGGLFGFVVMQNPVDALGPQHFCRLHSFWFFGIHDFFVDDVGQRLNSVRHIQIMGRDPVAAGVPPMLATLFESVASVVLDAWANRVVDLEIMAALISYVEHFLCSVAHDDERHERIWENVLPPRP